MEKRKQPRIGSDANRVRFVRSSWSTAVFSTLLLACSGGAESGSTGATGSGTTGAGTTGAGTTGAGTTGAGATGAGATGSGTTGAGATGSGTTGAGTTGAGAMGSGTTGAGATGSGATGAGGAAATGSGTGSGGAGTGATGGSATGGSDGGTGATGAGATGGTGGGGDPVPSTGCGSTVLPESGTFTMDVDGLEREYILTLPDDYDSSHAYPVIFGWHWLGGSAENVAGSGFGGLGGYYGLQNRANGTVIFVAGQGLPDDNGNRGWPNTNGRDIAFLQAMLERFRSELCVDESRILSTGFSFGGMMSDLIACQMGQTFRAIAPMAGRLIASYNSCVNEQVAAIVIHGNVDSSVPIESGAQFRDYLRGTNNCGDTSMPVNPSPCVAYEGCDTGYPVSWCEFEGDHMVPDFATEAIWDFFSQFLN